MILKVAVLLSYILSYLSTFNCRCVSLKGNSHMISPDRTQLISILLSNSRLPGHLMALDAYHIDSVNTCYD